MKIMLLGDPVTGDSPRRVACALMQTWGHEVVGHLAAGQTPTDKPVRAVVVEKDSGAAEDVRRLCIDLPIISVANLKTTGEELRSELEKLA